MSSTGGPQNHEFSRNIPQMKYVYVRRRRKAQERKEIENVPENHPPKETQPISIQDGSMLADAPGVPLLTSLSNTQLLQYVEFMAAATIRERGKEEDARGTATHGD